MPSQVVDVAVIVVSILALWAGARLFVDAAVSAARRLGLSELTIGLTVVAVGTSSPEIAVSLEAALEARPDIAVGNVVGSNIFNIAVILGVVTLVQWLPISRELVKRDGVAVLATAVLGVVVLLDGVVSRLEGVALVALFGAYLYVLFRLSPDVPDLPDPADLPPPIVGAADGGGEVADGDSSTTDGEDSTTPPVGGGHAEFGLREAALLVVGLALVVGGGQLLIDSATSLARAVGISEWVIGATIVAAGTSSPEFAVSLVSLKRGQAGVSVGNVLGSNIFNFLFILGLAATITPLSVAGPAFEGALWLFGLTALLVAALWSGRRLSRPEGGLLVGSEAVRWLSSLL
ncbi:sodium:calcium antiporter [Haloprofundus halobius]|uniref:sodium:calcium antiporter n=1 Tax=Haloprofundus halobius TaxID=2876194 RepID=UPI001CCA5895|nr:sodium:calcium antiporter [Haloprofundus halobius]